MHARPVTESFVGRPFFEEVLADDAVIVSNGQAAFAKQRVVDAHQPGTAPKFTRVEMKNGTILDHGTAAVVTGEGLYEGPQSSVTLKFMRVWVKTQNGWQIVAGTVSQ